jgi:WD40 repeat protein
MEGKKKRPAPVPLFVLRGHASPVYTCCFSDDGTKLVSGAGDGNMMIWDVASKRCTTRFVAAHSDKAINLVQFFAPGKLWTQGRDGFVKQWDLETEQCVSAHELGCHSFVSMALHKTENNNVCIAAMPDSNDMRGVMVLKLDSRERDVSVLHQWEGCEKKGMCMRLRLVAPSVDHLQLFCGYESGDIVVYDVNATNATTTAVVTPLPNVTKMPITALVIEKTTGIGCAGGAEATLFPFQARFLKENFFFVRLNSNTTVKMDRFLFLTFATLFRTKEVLV